MAKKKKQSAAQRQLQLFNRLLIGLLLAILLGTAVFLLLNRNEGESEVPEKATPTYAPAAPAAETPAAQPAVSVPSTPEPTPQPTPEPEPEYFTLSLIGDCTLAADTEKKSWGIGFNNVVGQNYAYPFENTVQYFSDDYMTLANLECCFSNKTYYSIEQFVFLSPAAYAGILREGSVEFVTLANNHTRDFGEQAYNDTCAALEAAAIKYAGEDGTYIYQRDDGVKVGVYCIYDQLTYNALSILSDSKREATLQDGQERIQRSIETLRSEGAEFTVCCLHMGREGYYEPTAEQTDMCRFAADCGYDLVYCTHSHRLQPVESYNGSLILYSMGNWSFGGHTNPGNGNDPGAYDTGIVQVTVKRVGDEASVDGYKLIPCSISSQSGVNDYRPTPYEEGSKEYDRAMSMFSGTYEGANYITNYSFLYE